MVNNSQHVKLDEVIKQALRNYEVSDTTTDWDRMESLLNSVPKSSSFKYKDALISMSESLKTIPKSISIKTIASPISIKWIRPAYIIIGLGLVVGSFVVYGIVHFYNTSGSNTNALTAPVTGNAAKIIMPSDSSMHRDSIVKVPQQLIDTIENIIPEEITNSNSSDTDEVAPDQKNNIAEKDANEEKNDKKNNKNKDEQNLKKNTSTLTDNHDSLKAIEGNAKENNSGNKTPPDNAATFDIIMQKHNADSVKKFLSKMPKDSLKAPN
jgi:hypothetical protein